MPHLKGIRSRGVIQVRDNVDFLGSVSGSGNEFQRTRFYVNANDGSDDDSGESWDGAKATIQAAVDVANALRYATKNVDIYVANGQYEETVEIKWAALGMTSAQNTAALLWTNMGLNCGKLGTLRIIGGGGVFGSGHPKWTCGTTATQPNLYVGRPNVEVHGFNIQMNETGGVAAGSWGDGDEMAGHSQHGMPAIVVEDQYNDDDLLNGAGNNFLLNNCRVNSGAAGLLNSGAKWVNATNCLFEYCTNGVSIIANSKGRASESLIQNCRFSMNTYDILHGYAVTCWVDRCDFISNNATAHLFPLAAHAASTYCTMTNCTGDTISKFCGGSSTVAKNNGWDGNFLTCAEGTGSIPAMGAVANWNHGDE